MLTLEKDTLIIQPGAPGMPSKILDSSEATNIANTSYIKADVVFSSRNDCSS